MSTLSEQVSAAIGVLGAASKKAEAIVETDAVIQTAAGPRDSLPMVLRKASEALADFGPYLVGAFEVGAITVTNPTQVVRLNATGDDYRWDGQYPKNVDAGTVASNGGEGVGKWVNVGSLTFKEKLKSIEGAGTIGTSTGENVEQRLKRIFDHAMPANLKAPLASMLAFNIDYARNNILIIGDSITKNVGASIHRYSYAACLAKALANHYKNGYSFPLHLNASNSEDIFSHTGAASSYGLGAESVTLSASQALIFCKCEAIAVAVIIDGSSSSCSKIELRVNGDVVAWVEKPTGNPGVAFLSTQNKAWESCDVVTVAPVGGDAVILGATPLKRGNAAQQNDASPLVITCGASGQSFNYYTANVSQVVKLLNCLYAVTPATCVIALGTNSIYNPTQAQTPTEYVSSLHALITAISSSTVANFVLTIPPQAIESVWPVIKSGYTYMNYSDAVKAYASEHYHDVINLNIPNLQYRDGVHPNDAGHISIAKHYCDILSIAADFSLPSINHTDFLIGSSPISIKNGYVSCDKNGKVSLRGVVSPNGASTNLLTTLPQKYRPSTQLSFPIALDSDGFGIVVISTNGEIRTTLASKTWSYAYLDGITY